MHGVSFQGPTDTDKGGVSAFFRKASTIDPIASRERDTPVYIDVDQVVFILPKDNKTRPVYLASEKYKKRFPGAWKAYQEKDSDVSFGTSLTELKGLTPADQATLRAAKVMNVEQLAAIDPATTEKKYGPNLQKWVKMAGDFMNRQDDETLNKMIAMEDENKALQDRLAKLEAAAAPKAEAPAKETSSKKDAA